MTIDIMNKVKVIDKYSPLYKKIGQVVGYICKNGVFEYDIEFDSTGKKRFASYDIEKVTLNIKTGDSVKIKPDCELYGIGKDNPKEMLGEVYNTNTLTDAIWVKWTNGEKNVYKEEDLKIVFGKDQPPELPKSCTCEIRVVVNFGCKCDAGQAELAKERA